VNEETQELQAQQVKKVLMARPGTQDIRATLVFPALLVLLVLKVLLVRREKEDRQEPQALKDQLVRLVQLVPWVKLVGKE